MTIEIIAWMGVLFYLIGYLLLVIKKISANGYSYHILNGLGAIALIFNASYLHDIPNIAVNAIWLLIAVYAFWHVFKIKRRRNKSINKKV